MKYGGFIGRKWNNNLLAFSGEFDALGMGWIRKK
jgi:hypothetical protein